jgi:N-glycosylase/DNA lyase
MLQATGEYDKFMSLTDESDPIIARQFLLRLQGVGRKVSDCVMLYSLGFSEIAPVDTHMFQIAERMFGKIKKNNGMHDVIQDLMNERFGERAGWAHCYLFAADLKHLKAEISPGKRHRKNTANLVQVQSS